MSTTDAQFDRLLSIAEENGILYKKERAAIMLMASCIYDKQRVRDVLRNPELKIQPKDKTLLLNVLSENNSYRRDKAYTVLFRQFGIHKNLIAEVLSVSERLVRNYHRWYREFDFEYLLNNSIGLNFDLSLLRALSMKIKQSSNNEKENLNRNDIDIGFVIYL